MKTGVKHCDKTWEPKNIKTVSYPLTSNVARNKTWQKYCLHFFKIVKLSTGASTSSQPGRQQAENDSWHSSANTSSLQPSSADSSSLCTHQTSPPICPGPQISDPPADKLQQEMGTPDASSALQSEPQEKSTGGKKEVGEEPKSCKKHLHCPMCKVTVNSTSQLEAHCSGVCKTTDDSNSC